MSRQLPPRDKRGRFRKRYVPRRDSRGRFIPKRSHPTKKELGKRARRVLRGQPAVEPEYNLCNARDRLAFYDRVIEDRRKLGQRLSPEDASAMSLQFEVSGKLPPKRTKSGKKSRRKTSAYIGKRMFHDMRKFKRFMLLDTGEISGRSEENPFGVDWSKNGLCQYAKTARLIVPPETRRQKVKQLRRYKIKGA